MHNLEYPKSYIVWDLETDGFDGRTNNILEIGAVEVQNGEIVKTHNWILNHGVPVPGYITEVNGITDEIIRAEGRDPKECIGEFVSLFRPGMAHLTHNGIRFDIPFLYGAMDKLLRDWKVGSHIEFREMLEANALDTAAFVKAGKLGMARKWNETFHAFATRVLGIIAKGVKYNVALCCQEMDIDMAGITLHRAGADCQMTHEIYKKLISKQPAS